MSEETNTRKTLFYLHGTTVLQELELLKGSNWMALVYVSEYDHKKHAQMIEKLLHAEPLFIYGVAQNFSVMEDEMAEQLISITGDFNDDDPLPIIMADSNLQEGLLFCRDIAFHETRTIEKVFVIDLLNETPNEQVKNQIAALK